MDEDRQSVLVARIVGRYLAKAGEFAPRTKPFKNGRERRVMLRRFRNRYRFGTLIGGMDFESLSWLKEPPFTVYCHPSEQERVRRALDSLEANYASIRWD